MKCIFASALIAAAASAQQVVDESFLQVKANISSLDFDLVANAQEGVWEVPGVYVGEETKVEVPNTIFALNKPYTYLDPEIEDLDTLTATEWVAGQAGETLGGIKGDVFTTQIGNKWSAEDNYYFVEVDVVKQTGTGEFSNWLGFARKESEQDSKSNYVKSLTAKLAETNGSFNSFSLGRKDLAVNLAIGSKNAKLFKTQPEDQPTETNDYTSGSTTYETDLTSWSTIAQTEGAVKSDIAITAKTVVFGNLAKSKISLPKADLAAFATALGFTGANNSADSGCSSQDLPNVEIKLSNGTLVLPPKIYTHDTNPNCALTIAEGDDGVVTLGGQLLDDFYVTFTDTGIQFEVAAGAEEGTLVTYGGASLLTAAAGIFAAVALAL